MALPGEEPQAQSPELKWPAKGSVVRTASSRKGTFLAHLGQWAREHQDCQEVPTVKNHYLDQEPWAGLILSLRSPAISQPTLHSNLGLRGPRLGHPGSLSPVILGFQD